MSRVVTQDPRDSCSTGFRGRHFRLNVRKDVVATRVGEMGMDGRPLQAWLRQDNHAA